MSFLGLKNSVKPSRESSGSAVECLTRDRGAAGLSLTRVTAKKIHPSLVLVHPRQTRSFITERLLMGCKESNQKDKPTMTPKKR